MASPQKKKLNVGEILEKDGFVPLDELLGFGDALWGDSDDGEFLPVPDDEEDVRDGAEPAVAAEASAGQAPTRPKRGRGLPLPVLSDSNLESASGVEDEDLYRRLLESSVMLDDEDEEYDLLDDIDGNVELLRKDMEDEAAVGNPEDEDIQFLRTEGGAGFLETSEGAARLLQTRKKLPRRKEDEMSSPAKNTRSAVMALRVKHPVLKMNVPDCELHLEVGEPTAAQKATIQTQLNALQQLLVEGIGLASLDNKPDLLKLYRSICLELEVHVMGTEFNTNMLNRAAHLTDISQIHHALGSDADPRLMLSDVRKSSAKRQREGLGTRNSKRIKPTISKKTGTFFSNAQDELLALGLSRLYTPETFQGYFRVQALQTHYFPLLSKETLQGRISSRTSNNALENPIKSFLRRLKSSQPWSKEEQCYLIMWSRRYPGDVRFERAMNNPNQSQLKMRLSEKMMEERGRLRVELPTLDAEDNFLRINGVDLSKVNLEEVIMENDFDQEDIDSSLDSEEMQKDLYGPPHPRMASNNPDGWTREEDALLLMWIKQSLSAKCVPENVIAELAEKMGRATEQVQSRAQAWRNMYLTKEWKQRLG